MLPFMNTSINPTGQGGAFRADSPGPRLRLPAPRPSRVARAFAGLIIPSLLLALSIGCLQVFEKKQGSGVEASEARSVEGEVTAVNLYGSPTVNITVEPGAETRIVVTTDDNLLADVLTEMEGGALSIRTQGNLRPTKGITVQVTVPSLDAVSLYGSGDMNVAGLAAGDFVASLTGSGDIRLAGKCDTANFQLTGSGDLAARDLEAQSATAKLTGSGDISLTARASASLGITGSGDIVVAGTPAQITRSVTGSGSIRSE